MPGVMILSNLKGGDTIFQYVIATLAIAILMSREIREWLQLLKKK